MSKTLYKVNLTFLVIDNKPVASYGYDVTNWSVQRIVRLVKEFKSIYPQSEYEIEIKEKTDDSITQ